MTDGQYLILIAISAIVLPVDLTKKQIEDSPALASHEPVSRQYETQYYGYYGWPDYRRVRTCGVSEPPHGAQPGSLEEGNCPP